MSLNVLSLQPFYGGSHASFIDGWKRHSRHRWTQLDLPARFWKWRMRHAAIEFAHQVDLQWSSGTPFDLIVTTDMLNVAEFRGLLKTAAREIPLMVYFHENQLVYPNQKEEPRDLHFAFTNLTSAVAADAVWFNSRFNRDSMLAELTELASMWPDYPPVEAIRAISRTCQVQSPGIEVPNRIERGRGAMPREKPMHLVWAARWEHDKDPDALWDVLNELRNRTVDFRVSVLGESFRKTPPVFARIKSEFAENVVRFGFQDSREAYWEALCEADVFLSTARHEFFGIAVVEGIAAGLVPVLPDRLAYPELVGRLGLPNKCLYQSPQQCLDIVMGLAESIVEVRANRSLPEFARRAVELFGWEVRGRQMDDELESIVKRKLT